VKYGDFGGWANRVLTANKKVVRENTQHLKDKQGGRGRFDAKQRH
jgi:hypothetical protein